jgi:hypothetical protein
LRKPQAKDRRQLKGLPVLQANAFCLLLARLDSCPGENGTAPSSILSRSSDDLVGYELRVQKGEGSDILADRVEFMAIITNYNESVRKMQRARPLDEQKKAASNEATFSTNCKFQITE